MKPVLFSFLQVLEDSSFKPQYKLNICIVLFSTCLCGVVRFCFLVERKVKDHLRVTVPLIFLKPPILVLFFFLADAAVMLRIRKIASDEEWIIIACLKAIG